MSFFFWPQQAGSNFLGFGRSRPEATFLVLAAAGRKQPFWFCPLLAGSNYLGFGRSRPKATYLVLAAAGRKRIFWFGRSSPEATFLALAAAFHFLVLAAAGQIQLFWFCPQLFGCSRPEEAFLVFGRSRLDATILVGARAGRSQT